MTLWHRLSGHTGGDGRTLIKTSQHTKIPIIRIIRIDFLTILKTLEGHFNRMDIGSLNSTCKGRLACNVLNDTLFEFLSTAKLMNVQNSSEGYFRMLMALMSHH